jgi:23S rRNA (cytidine1920-2'-O)/16S rRNA (cytidine1409-2'-O)-methyltransferase
VRDAGAASQVEHRVREACARHDIAVQDWFASPIAGGDGNREFFLWGQAR